MIDKKRVAIYIDGSNFYFKLKTPKINIKKIRPNLIIENFLNGSRAKEVLFPAVIILE